MAEYLFGYRFSLVMRFVYLGAIFIGAIGGLKFVWMLIDLLFGLAVVPNMISVLLLSGVIVPKTKEFHESERYAGRKKRSEVGTVLDTKEK